MRWRVIRETAPRGGAENMALDAALAACVGAETGVLRLYRWSSATVSFGRNQPARGIFDAEEARMRDIGFVRRPTGGRAVLHDDEVTYSAVFTKRALGSARQAYRSIHRGLAAGLRTLGVDARVVSAEEGKVLLPDAGPCFRAPAPGELVAGGRKVVGSAQVRIGEAILQHGSILVGGSQRLLSILADEGPDGDVPPVTLTELLGRPTSPDQVMKAVCSGLETELGGDWVESGYTSRELSEAEAFEAKFGSEEWTWRR